MKTFRVAPVQPQLPQTETITGAQANYITTLAGERGIPVISLTHIKLKKEASSVITWLLTQPPRKQVETRREAPPSLPVGVYELPEGTIYIVRPSRSNTGRVYAERLVEFGGTRLTESEETVNFKFEYEKGAIYRIRLEDRMSLERAEQLTIRYRKCIICRTTLKAAKSVKRGIGPVCIKYFPEAAVA